MISIKKYDAVIEHGSIHYYAIDLKGKRYPMPDAFAEMYDDSHLAIELAHNDRPEMFNIDTPDYYIPLFTGASVNE